MAVFNGLGRALRLLRDRKDLSQKDVAAAAGVTPPMLSAYENGRSTPEVKTLDRILDRGLHCSLGELARALDLVNDRTPNRPAGELLGRSSGGSSAGHATPDPAVEIEEGTAEVARGLLRICRSLQASPRRHSDDEDPEDR